MSFLSPLAAAIAAAIAIPALISLYFLKLKRRPVKVPTTLLWQRAVHDMQVNSPFQRLKNSWLLWLQLLLLLLLLLAFARPAIRALATPGERVVIVIDHSASMNAKDAGDQTRLEAAKEAALRIIDELEGTWSAEADDVETSGIMVVTIADQANAVQGFTGDLGKARAAIRSIEPTDQASDFNSALGLIEPHTRTTSGDGQATTVHILSDGRFNDRSMSGDGPPSLGNADVRFIRVGGGTDAAPAEYVDNIGIARLSTRRDPEVPERVQVFVQLVNSNGGAVDTNVTLKVNDRTVGGGIRRVTMPAAQAAAADGTPGVLGEAQVQYDFVLSDSALIEVTHDHEDLLSADDRAMAVLAPSRRLRVLMVTRGNPYLRAGVQAAEPQSLVTMTPEQYEQQSPESLSRGGWEAPGGTAADDGFDAIVFDNYSPEMMPPTPTISLGGVPPVEGLSIKPSPEGAPPAEYLLNWRRDHPILRNVELSDIVLRKPGRLALPRDARVLATATAGPVMAEVVRDGTRHIVASFDVLESDWPLFISFPTFFQNAMGTLGLGNEGDEASVMFATGSNPVVPAPADADSVVYEGPTRLQALARDGVSVLPALPMVGLYQPEHEAEPPYDRLAVNLLDEVESDLRPATSITVGTEQVAGQEQAAAVRREIWPWFVWGALGLLLFEWFFYTRRMRL